MKNNDLKKSVFSKFKSAVLDNRLDSSSILSNGILLTCVILSIASGFIDIVFFSGVSKSNFLIGTLRIAASILYTLISIGLISGKFWCAMQIGMLKELKSRLKAKGKTWYSNLNKALIPWHLAHKFLISISLMTALSLSVNSIGLGLSKIEQNLDNMSKDIAQLLSLTDSVDKGIQDKRSSAKENISGLQEARVKASQETAKYWSLLEEYQTKMRAIRANETLTEEEKESQIAVLKKNAVASIPVVTSRNVEYISESEFKREFAKITQANEVVDSSKLYEESIAYDQEQINDTILAIADKEYRTPDGELIKFVNEDGSLVNVQMAISRLQNGYSAWRNDTGDVGESSRVFTLIATYIKLDSQAGGMGASEWILMIFIALVGVVQEFLIALFTPKSVITRKTLSQVSAYLEWSTREEKEKFLISVFQDYAGDGILTKKEFEERCRECVSYMEETEDIIISKYSKTAKAPKVTSKKLVTSEFSDKVDQSVKEVEDLLK